MFFICKLMFLTCMNDCTVADVWSLNKMTIIIAQSGCFLCHLLLLANRANPVSRSDSKSQMTK